MNINVTKTEVSITNEYILNDKEYNVNKCYFIFSNDYTNDLVKKAIFVQGTQKIEQIILDNECNIPEEVLNRGTFELRVYAYAVQNDELILRYSPAPTLAYVRAGSYLKDTTNSDHITPTDKEQIEQMLNNINLSVTKNGRIVTISFTNTDGVTQTETVEDGKSLEFKWEGTSLGIRQEGQSQYEYVNLKGDKGDAGAIKFEIVQQLPTTGIEEDTIYLVPITPDTQGNNYEEYIYVNGAWELLGKIGVQVDLSNYYTKQETYSKTEIDNIIGNINTALDTINGEVI